MSAVPSIIDLLSLSRQNVIQRSGFFASLAAIAVVVFLHFPFDGYTIYEWETNPNRHLCPSEEEHRKFNKAVPDSDVAAKLEFLKYCYEAEEMLQPFSQWRSDKPIVLWLGSTLHTALTVGLLLGLGLFWLWVFRKP